MPVRFRCHHCHQLLGIARRKIGMEVDCPTCHNKVLVPPTDAPDVDQPADRQAGPALRGQRPRRLAATVGRRSGCRETAGCRMAGPAASGAINVEPYNPPSPPPAAPPPGVVLSPFQATLLTVGTVLLLAVFFTVGLLIGRFWF